MAAQVEPVVEVEPEPVAHAPLFSPASPPLVDPATLPVAPRTAAVVAAPLPGEQPALATAGGLTRRVPRASLQPELRHEATNGNGYNGNGHGVNGNGNGHARPAGATGAARPSPFASTTRTPAELRSMLSKFQAGQARARSEVAAAPAAPEPTRTSRRGRR
jgi:hypothetical protein